MAREILVFQHVPHEPPGLLQRAAAKRGVDLQVVELWKPGYQIPQPGNHSSLIIMGGPQAAYEGPDKYPSKRDELEYIRAVVGKTPIIGFCLGSQLLATALDGKVYPDVRDGVKHKEIGYYEEQLTDAGENDPIFRGFKSPLEVFHWHGDVFDLPSGATLLVTSDAVPNQAFRYGDRAYGMLFHMEFTPEMVRRLVQVDNTWAHTGFELDEERLFRQADENAALAVKQSQQLFDNFLDLPYAA